MLQRESDFFGVDQSWESAFKQFEIYFTIRNHFRNRLWKAAISSTVNDPSSTVSIRWWITPLPARLSTRIPMTFLGQNWNKSNDAFDYDSGFFNVMADRDNRKTFLKHFYDHSFRYDKRKSW